MINIRNIQVLTVAIVMASSPASAIELTGVWASEADMCSQVFSKRGSHVAFTEMSELYGSGFIIEGNSIRGKSANCTIKSKKENAGSVEISAACATSIMNQDMKFVLKVIDDNNISRSFPDISDMSVKFTRCAM